MPIEQHNPALTRTMSRDQAVEELASGFGTYQGPTEAPLYWHEGGARRVTRYPQRRMCHDRGERTPL
jgi:hypothetical protein